MFLDRLSKASLAGVVRDDLGARGTYGMMLVTMNQTTTPREDAMRAKLKAAFAPDDMKLENTSRAHEGHGHAGHESHFRVMLVSRAFEGKARLERHRMVNAILAQELESGLHALEIRALTPAEARGLSL